MRDDNEPMNLEEAARLQNLDEQIDQRLRERSRPADRQEPLDPELLRDLQNIYQPRAQRFQSGLGRVWNRLEQQGAVPAQAYHQRSRPIDRPGLRSERLRPMERFFRTGQRWSARVTSLVAVALLVILVGGLTLGLILVRHNGNSSTGSSQHQPTATIKHAPFTVTSVDLAVTPASIDGMTCGSSVSLTYTATFHLPARTAGGTIQFEYTLDNGRSSTNASVTVDPGQTTQTYTFTSSGTLPPDHTYPGIAEVLVQSPNAVHSPQVQPSGSCVAGAAFQVTGVDMAVSPATLTGLACGTQATVTYTATFHIAPGGPGGTIQFGYTTNNGRGSTNASVSVAAGQTTATYSFTWSGQLPADHTAPGQGGVIVTSPNQVNSALVAPTGSCN
ncbi:MAG TPA: hypothetical protein VFU32_13145 [Ktedonobacterales bacterium]|nr:hypothetical protein [Ktedonobacterales bacterium]